MSRTDRFNLVRLTELSMALLALFLVLLAVCLVLLFIGVSVVGWIFDLDLRPFVPLSGLIWALCLVGFAVLRLWASDLETGA